MNTLVIKPSNARKYNFDNMEVGESRPVPAKHVSTAINCFKSYAKKRKLNWECKASTVNGIIVIERTN